MLKLHSKPVSAIHHLNISIIIAILFVFVCSNLFASPKSDELLRQGIDEFKKENYEEAIDFLRQARNIDAQSSVPAYYMGLSSN